MFKFLKNGELHGKIRVSHIGTESGTPENCY